MHTIDNNYFVQIEVKMFRCNVILRRTVANDGALIFVRFFLDHSIQESSYLRSKVFCYVPTKVFLWVYTVFALLHRESQLNCDGIND